MNAHSIQAAMAFLESWLGFQFSQADLPGLSVAISIGDELVFSRAYGLANVSTKKVLTTDHCFAIGSQSKMFTSVAILRLAEAGRLDLDDPALKYLPWLAHHPHAQAKHMTIRQLLSHGSGLMREGKKANYWQQSAPFPTKEELKQQVLEADFPALQVKHAKYSNLAFSLLGQIIERLSGMSYESYVKECIISPLDLVRTSTAVLDPIVTGYTPRQFHKRHPLHFRGNTNSFASVTGVVSTPEDMCHFITSIFTTKRLLNSKSQDEIQAAQERIATGYDQGVSFGLGMERVSVGGRLVVGHSGHALGQNTATFFDAKTGCAVSIATNCKDGSAKQMAVGVFEALHFFECYAVKPTPPHLQRFAARVMNKYASVEIIPTAGAIIAIDPNDWQPFGWADHLTYEDSTVLRVVTQGSLFNEGECIHFDFAGDLVKSIDFAGITLTSINERQG